MQYLCNCGVTLKTAPMNPNTQTTKSGKLNRSDIEKKRHLAYILYVNNGLNQKAISDLIDISEQSITTWKRAGKWDAKRAQAISRIDSEITTIRGMIDRKLSEIENRPAPGNVPDTKEADAIHKLVNSIKQLRCEELTNALKAVKQNSKSKN